MKTKTIKIKNIDSVRKYLTIFSGVFGLTSTELDVLAALISYKLKAMAGGTNADPFSTTAKQHVANKLGMENPYSINTYVSRLRAKRAILPDGGGIHPWLMPTGEKRIVIEPGWNLDLSDD